MTTGAMELEREPFGSAAGGIPVERFTLRGPLILRVTNYGATITEVHAPDREGRLGDVVLGFDRLEPYLAGTPYFGGTIGRVANRIANSAFALDGTEYSLAANEGRHHLHGGPAGFDRAVWSAEAEPVDPGSGEVAVRFRHISPDGDQGYPGRVDVVLRIALTARSEIVLDYEARAERPTPISLTNHSYWNLAGAGSGDVGAHRLTVKAEAYLPVDRDRVPTGEIAAVEGTPFDFRSGAPMGARRGLLPSGGYDHNFIPVAAPGPPWEAATRSSAHSAWSARAAPMRSTVPGFRRSSCARGRCTARGLSIAFRPTSLLRCVSRSTGASSAPGRVLHEFSSFDRFPIRDRCPPRGASDLHPGRRGSDRRGQQRNRDRQPSRAPGPAPELAR
jgi:aldose 1-epimerase